MASHSVEFWPQGDVCVSFIWFWHYFSTIYKYWLNVIQIEGIHLRAHQRVCACVFSSLFCIVDGSCLLFWVHASYTAASYCFIINYILKTRPIIYLNKYQIFIAIQLEAVQTMIMCMKRKKQRMGGWYACDAKCEQILHCKLRTILSLVWSTFLNYHHRILLFVMHTNWNYNQTYYIYWRWDDFVNVPKVCIEPLLELNERDEALYGRI